MATRCHLLDAGPEALQCVKSRGGGSAGGRGGVVVPYMCDVQGFNEEAHSSQTD